MKGGKILDEEREKKRGRWKEREFPVERTQENKYPRKDAETLNFMRIADNPKK